MSDGAFSKQSSLNAGVIPASPEELSQRYLKLFQQYSRLKAKHAILRNAVLEEQASNVELQGNVKEKEKKLRKLQEQLDLLAFHNERLTKRIQAVQDNENKGTHFSLLGNSFKKELEKNSRALEEANLDLERKIAENEKLHEELSERQFEFTENINKLLKQIQDLEKKINELQDENTSLQAESRNTAATTSIQPETNSINQEQYDQLVKELETLKLELKKKTDLLEEKEKMAKKDDLLLLSEIQSLRAIVLAKVGDLKNEEEKSLYDLVDPASAALKELENQAKEYILAIKEERKDMKELPSEIAKKLATSTDTYSKELLRLLSQLEDSKNELNKLLQEKEEQLVDEKKKKQEYEERIQEQTRKISDLVNTIETNQGNEEKATAELRVTSDKLEKENMRLQEELKQQELKTERALQELNDTKETNNKKETSDKEIQVNPNDDDNADDDDTTFVYPKKLIEQTPIELENDNKKEEAKEEAKEESKEEEEEEVFVYRGRDAVDSKTDHSNEDDILAREERLKSYYEQKVKNLTEKIQMTDSKAVRFASMYTSLKERLMKEDKEKEMMVAEIERLNKEVKNVQDMLATTETNYQKQVDTMTEFISSLQQNAMLEEQRHLRQTPNNNNNYHRQR
ncbi:MAG: hypothetical protein EXX96DRAFT_598447 [Benjaminiella poitrasii]|nr:MAG: hypothetical protein EXX96DRAFT_598447 [Benjaminiella poitrasii]